MPIRLRPYQKEAVEAALREREAGVRRQLLRTVQSAVFTQPGARKAKQRVPYS